MPLKLSKRLAAGGKAGAFPSMHPPHSVPPGEVFLWLGNPESWKCAPAPKWDSVGVTHCGERPPAGSCERDFSSRKECSDRQRQEDQDPFGRWGQQARAGQGLGCGLLPETLVAGREGHSPGVPGWRGAGVALPCALKRLQSTQGGLHTNLGMSEVGVYTASQREASTQPAPGPAPKSQARKQSLLWERRTQGETAVSGEQSGWQALEVLLQAVEPV